MARLRDILGIYTQASERGSFHKTENGTQPHIAENLTQLRNCNATGCLPLHW